MILAVASGKGGTGKTTIAVSLALSLAGGEGPAPMVVDCDVEEPNAALFLRPEILEREEVGQLIPEIDAAKCNYCGECARVCQYNAIAVVAERVLVFPELCHGCGSCTLNCPQGAIREVLNVMGVMERGVASGIDFAQGRLNVGEPMAVPIIRALKRWVLPPRPPTSEKASTQDRVHILDAPPGNACPVVETMRGADFVLMVTEPTPFGLHDLRLAVDVARGELGLPVGVVINRDGIGDQGVEAFCKAEEIPILMRIPLDRRIAEAYSEGLPLIEVLPSWREKLRVLYGQILEIVEQRVQRKVGEGA